MLLEVVLSSVFPHEPMSWLKLAGIVLTVAGVVILAQQAYVWQPTVGGWL